MNAEDHIEDDNNLPDFVVAMRSALNSCNQIFQGLLADNKKDVFLVKVDSVEKESAEGLNNRRDQAYADFWNERINSEQSAAAEVVPIIQANSLISPKEFREKFHNLNLPCLIQYEDNETKGKHRSTGNQLFGYVNENWRKTSQSEVNREWFVEHVGPETQVPLRCSTSADLDSEGRSMECETRQVSLKEWIQMLESSDIGMDNPYYLKDWHLVTLLEERQQKRNPLYTCPDVFQNDLLNPFLVKFTGGDYRFCYWGPNQSKTHRHSDVLHSFSWSYNVIGTKRWTFFKNQEENGEKITVLQRSGQAIFVPCTWQHEVENIEETISINHNWITVANLSLAWECLQAEMKEIESELKGWGINHEDTNFLESCESMLRGCVGLNVTSFFAMSLIRLLKLLETASKGGQYSDGNELQFDCYLLVRMIQSIMKDDLLQLEKRVESVVLSKDLAKQSCEIAFAALQLVQIC